MNIKQACIILDDENVEWDYKVNCVFNGLVLLQKANPNGLVIIEAAEHDEIYSYGTDETLPNMTEDDVKQMAVWGWSIVDKCWHHFV